MIQYRVSSCVFPWAFSGVQGIALSFVNYLDELPFVCAEVLPRLARAGFREPPGRAAALVPT